MHDDNPLWYDYAEPDEPPGKLLLALAGLFSVTASAVTAPARFRRVVQELWCGRVRARMSQRRTSEWRS
ncbi:hypothetical protein [Methylobacterium tardum]|uniref:Uncharacterized protein n=1 Tax=Methylobacterium tardum TaxID=374432 RepID=A0AA37TG43_9HYPH|nr:hypothetical protein [Methylobacterium tardum]GLS68103.1 hypothetical protein GCM10007890_01140 [Methylobacterium tardum]